MTKDTRELSLAQLKIQPKFQIRAALTRETVTEYAEAMQAGDAFPPIQVVKTETSYILADGFHRVEAVQALGLKTIFAEITEGGEAKALEIAIESNRKHGLRFTTADKQRATASFLRQWPEKSDRQIAAMIGISAPFVGKERVRLNLKTPVRVGADGKLRRLPIPKRALPTREESPLPPRKHINQNIVDSTNLPVPEESLVLWSKGTEEVPELIRLLTHFQTQLETILECRNILYAEIASQLDNDIAKCKAIKQNLERAKPYAVCPQCQGKLPQDCKTCSSRGFVSKFYWKTLVSAEMRAIRGDKA